MFDSSLNRLTLCLRFPVEFPMSPPEVWLRRPRMQHRAGTGGGARAGAPEPRAMASAWGGFWPGPMGDHQGGILLFVLLGWVLGGGGRLKQVGGHPKKKESRFRQTHQSSCKAEISRDRVGDKGSVDFGPDIPACF